MGDKEIKCHVKCGQVGDKYICCFECKESDNCKLSWNKCNTKCNSYIIAEKEAEVKSEEEDIKKHHNKINKLLDVEVILRGMSSREELILSVISNKAKAIYNKIIED